MNDGTLNSSEMSILEMIVLIYVLLSCVSTVGVAIKHAFSRGLYMWVLLNLMIWPVSFYYLWKTIGEQDKVESSFDDITKRS